MSSLTAMMRFLAMSVVVASTAYCVGYYATLVLGSEGDGGTVF